MYSKSIRKNEDIEAFLMIEKRHCLYDIQVMGLPIWILIRFDAWDRIMRSKIGIGEYYFSESMSIKKMLLLMCRTVFFRRPPKSKVMVINHERRVREGGDYICPYTETIAQHYNAPCFESPHNYSHMTPARTKSIYYIDRIQVVSNVLFRVQRTLKMKSYKRVKEEVIKKLSSALNDMEMTYNVEVRETIISIAMEQIMKAIYKQRSIKKILQAVEPKVLIMPNAYSATNMLFAIEAHSKNIAVVEMMHGMINESHIAYQYAKSGKNRALPDYFFSFSNYWNTFIHYPRKQTRIVTVGWPYFDEKYQRYHKQKQEKDERVNILFLSQGTYGNRLSLIASRLRERLTKNKYSIVYKLHPGEYSIWREKYPCLIGSEIDVVESSEQDIYHYFASSDIQVGCNSTALYEGVAYGLPTFVLKIKGNNMEASDLVDLQLAEFFFAEEDLYDKIIALEKNREERQSKNIFFASGAFDNVIRAIDDILDGANNNSGL